MNCLKRQKVKKIKNKIRGAKIKGAKIKGARNFKVTPLTLKEKGKMFISKQN